MNIIEESKILKSDKIVNLDYDLSEDKIFEAVYEQQK